MSEFGPFTNVVAIGLALGAVFSTFLVRMVGQIPRWTSLIDEPPDFLIKAGARIVTVAVMATAFTTINENNSSLWLLAALASGILGLFFIRRFDLLRRIHIVNVVEVGPDGDPLIDSDGEIVYRNLVLGTESNMNPAAAEDYREARQQGPLSLKDFMAGYGSINDPGDIWSPEVLASTATRLSGTLIYIVLFAVVALFLAALVIDVRIV